MCGAWSCAEVGKVVTLYEAMEKRGVDINYNDGYDLKTNKIVNLDQTLAAARQSDVVIVAMGEQAWESGEMRSKGDISIAAEQQRLVSELVKTGKPVVVLMMCGRPVIFNEVRRRLPLSYVPGGWGVKRVMLSVMYFGEIIILRVSCQ